MASSTQLRVLIPLYPQFNTLDVNGPLEVLGNAAFSSLPTQPFSALIASATPTTPAYEFAKLQADLDLTAALSMIKSHQIDVLIIPGAGSEATSDMLKADTKAKTDYFALITAFLQLDTADKPHHLISICTGALLVGAYGGFSGMTATTHWAGLGTLSSLCSAYSTRTGLPPTTVVRKRFVHGGKTATGVKVLSSGGISCGLDCTLWFLSRVLGLQAAVDVAAMMDYNWNFEHEPLQPLKALGMQPTGWTTPAF